MKKLLCLSSALLLITANNANAGVIDLSGVGYVQYGDAQSYSLPIAQIQDGCTGPGCDFHVASTPGHIQDLIVVATGSSGTGVTTNIAGMDDAYATPSGESGSNFFSTGTVLDPNSANEFFGDSDNTWDTTLSALLGFLNGDDMVFMFNNNNLNGGNLQSLAAWMRITVSDDNGGVVGVYDLTNNNSAYNLVTQDGGGTFMGDVTSYTSDNSEPDGNTNTNTDYVLSGGPICLNTVAELIPVPVACDGSGPYPVTDGPINHNLGSDEVAYAVLFPELNDQLYQLANTLTLQELTNYTLNIDLRLGCDPDLFLKTADDEICSGALHGYGKNINNGFEQLFIATNTRQGTDIPEPPLTILFATAVLAMLRKKLF
ncbi:hypothetical protein [Thalassotalea ganghwensis]